MGMGVRWSTLTPRLGRTVHLSTPLPLFDVPPRLTHSSRTTVTRPSHEAVLPCFLRPLLRLPFWTLTLTLLLNVSSGERFSSYFPLSHPPVPLFFLIRSTSSSRPTLSPLQLNLVSSESFRSCCFLCVLPWRISFYQRHRKKKKKIMTQILPFLDISNHLTKVGQIRTQMDGPTPALQTNRRIVENKGIFQPLNRRSKGSLHTFGKELHPLRKTPNDASFFAVSHSFKMKSLNIKVVVGGRGWLKTK